MAALSINALRTKKDDLRDLIETYHSDSFLLDSNRLAMKRNDYYDERTYYEFVTAQQIYDEFVIVDNNLKPYSCYSPKRMFQITKRLLGNRFDSFKNIYKREYQIEPVGRSKYLKHAQQDLYRVLKKYEMDIAIEKWDDRAKNEVIKSMVILTNYYKSTGQFDLANIIRDSPILKPKTFTQIAKKWREFHTVKMAKKCNIAKKEANKSLQNIIKEIKQNF